MVTLFERRYNSSSPLKIGIPNHHFSGHTLVIASCTHFVEKYHPMAKLCIQKTRFPTSKYFRHASYCLGSAAKRWDKGCATSKQNPGGSKKRGNIEILKEKTRKILRGKLEEKKHTYCDRKVLLHVSVQKIQCLDMHLKFPDSTVPTVNT